jgi:hypothetical protein
MKKITILAATLAAACQVGFSQLSTRENDETTYKLGARPTAGNYSLMFGLGLGNNEAFQPINLLKSGDLITGKYYKTDNFVIRGGLNLMKEDSVVKGTGDKDFSTYDTYLDSKVEREFMLRPGFEYHFSNSNIFDVYAGSDLHLGFSKTVTRFEYENLNDDDFETTKDVSRTKNLGLSPFVGVQMFVLDWPVSIGVEYGFDALWKFGAGVTKTTTESSVGGNDTDAEFYTVDGSGEQFSKVKAKTVDINSNQTVKVVLNVYFGKGGKSAE